MGQSSLLVAKNSLPQSEAYLNASFEPVPFLADGTITACIPDDQSMQFLEIPEQLGLEIGEVHDFRYRKADATL